MVHNESSTGVTEDLAAIGAALRERPTLLLVDSVSGLAGTEMKMDAWGADIVVSASQKCLMCPPGLGFAAVSAKAWELVKREGTVPRFFYDFRRARAALEKGETAFTPPVSLVYGLREALRMIAEEGLVNVVARTVASRRLCARAAASSASSPTTARPWPRARSWRSRCREGSRAQRSSRTCAAATVP